MKPALSAAEPPLHSPGGASDPENPMLSLLLTSLACRHPAEGPPPPPPQPAAISRSDLEEIAASYRSSYRLAASLTVSPEVEALCRMPIPGRDLPYHADGQASPRIPVITVYASAEAWPALQQRSGERTFAPGSVIVKEKRDGSLGIMARPSSEGWQYAYIDAAGQLEADQAALAHCAACHQRGTIPEGAGWIPPEILRESRDAVFLSASQ